MGTVYDHKTPDHFKDNDWDFTHEKGPNYKTLKSDGLPGSKKTRRKEGVTFANVTL